MILGPRRRRPYRRPRSRHPRRRPARCCRRHYRAWRRPRTDCRAGAAPPRPHPRRARATAAAPSHAASTSALPQHLHPPDPPRQLAHQRPSRHAASPRKQADAPHVRSRPAPQAPRAPRPPPGRARAAPLRASPPRPASQQVPPYPFEPTQRARTPAAAAAAGRLQLASRASSVAAPATQRAQQSVRQAAGRCRPHTCAPALRSPPPTHPCAAAQSYVP